MNRTGIDSIWRPQPLLALTLSFCVLASGAAAQPPQSQPLVGKIAQSAQSAQPRQLGRLFLTPAWRDQLEQRRQIDRQHSRAREDSTLRLDGLVVRSSGQTTLWINQRPQTDGAHTSDVAAAGLRVGETLNRATRETFDGLVTGDIRVNRPPAQPQ